MLMSLTSWILTTFLILDPMYFRSKWCPGSQLQKITLSFFTLVLFLVPWGTRKSTSGRKIQKLVESYRICFRWFWAFHFFAYRSQIFLSYLNFSGTLGYQKKYKWQKNPKISGVIQNLFQVISSILFFSPTEVKFFHTWTFSGTLGYQKKYKWRKNLKISGIIQNLFQMILSIYFFPPTGWLNWSNQFSNLSSDTR